ncbi:hypothetical protein LTR91_022632 [Friedmanniomyces endolithicus]|uniref:Uncharacterized protein n=1 Tax=Friedmanniomyces endolithicus TaxID=329885 RepID=A0AAN6F4Z9_9PEZI|nr:hypothetical protein LTR01_008740 [Friedmanniomyces endolithicus]KAK0304143.1 hypothetical protein LTR82_017283 [Friedmanniomyces endolithicus]KAK0894254.1 hypothetical protein LTR57_023606 [Friedmanniomyces endolithicus]KAK0955911.1 hypothetical protein LTR91_022632 [Friedmanniomyces endolithicus]KAK1023232.1 hypothetical protein LTS16_025069 [Friedmanniomyces endolithicus]
MLCQDQPFGKAEAVSDEVDLGTALQELNSEGKPYILAYDQRDVRRLAASKRLSDDFASSVSFALVTSVFSLSNGGTAGTIWLTLIACCGMFLSCLSMAEMASISPTAGGQ